MKILVVDNGTSYIESLKQLLAEKKFEVISFADLSIEKEKDFDLFILSGGHSFPVVGNESLLENEIEFIRNCNKPILGICFGFELIAHVFGAKLQEMKEKEKGLIKIEVIEPDDLFLTITNFSVFESHRWVVASLGNEMVSLARSQDGVEVIKHKSLPVYGVQFHPEMFVEQTCGREIFNNFLHLI